MTATNKDFLTIALITILLVVGVISCRSEHVNEGVESSVPTSTRIIGDELDITGTPILKASRTPATTQTSTSFPVSTPTPSQAAVASTPPNTSVPPTITLVATPPDSPLKGTRAPYDDFEDPQYEHGLDTSHFSIASGSQNSCHISQENGVLRIQKPDLEGFVNCSLSVDRPISVKSTSLEDMHITSLLGSDHNGREVYSALGVETRFDDINTAWIAECGIWGFDDGPHALFIIRHLERGQGAETVYFEEIPLEYDTWYPFVIGLNQDSMELDCRVDRQLLGVYNLASDRYFDRILNLRFLRWIEIVYFKGSLATILLDDFYLESSP